MKIDVINLDNKVVGSVDLPKDIFGVDVRQDILQRVVLWQRAKARAGTHKVKQIGDIKGTTKKPFSQKGTGNARQGSKYGPHMRGGAVVFGPVVRSHDIKLQKKVRQLGLKMALSAKVASKDLKILDLSDVKDIKTKDMAKSFKTIGFDSVLCIDGAQLNVNFARGVSNIKHADILPTMGANVYDILNHKALVLTKEAVDALKTRLTN
ncbi:MAG: 50S ribosomal protein L4 [Alphaproteobacteria bacterium]|nr:50S ribosomal protein L4 [Alphaproteobacteria bacterium]MBN2780208.1 50S ribosomal protein L4 [Alphaproteobacteria bacterium]